ncbi:hypothetical protein BJ508DRAFT_323437 [Ascobolus immersus RN42]|uniref:Uncharacterized protein n=1 Tax=Ascobolus immersus RN42 TaxID=1160509 RepID=A0A3N4IK11_ASCIM|nr:hypothetical protein BJ508DRAFT_323437 [Ascobolus immersus RN42]
MSQDPTVDSPTPSEGSTPPPIISISDAPQVESQAHGNPLRPSAVRSLSEDPIRLATPSEVGTATTRTILKHGHESQLSGTFVARHYDFSDTLVAAAPSASSNPQPSRTPSHQSINRTVTAVTARTHEIPDLEHGATQESESHSESSQSSSEIDPGEAEADAGASFITADGNDETVARDDTVTADTSNVPYLSKTYLFVENSMACVLWFDNCSEAHKYTFPWKKHVESHFKKDRLQSPGFHKREFRCLFQEVNMEGNCGMILKNWKKFLGHLEVHMKNDAEIRNAIAGPDPNNPNRPSIHRPIPDVRLLDFCVEYGAIEAGVRSENIGLARELEEEIFKRQDHIGSVISGMETLSLAS